MGTNKERITELENGLREILKLRNLESIKEVASDLVGEDPEDYLEDDYLDLESAFLDDDFDYEEGREQRYDY